MPYSIQDLNCNDPERRHPEKGSDLSDLAAHHGGINTVALPRLAVLDCSFCRPARRGLIDPASEQRQSIRVVAVRIGGDHDPGRRCSPRVLGGKIQPFRAGVELEKATILPCLFRSPVNTDLIRTLEQEARPAAVACPRILK
jgi:hypothetical protein